MRTNPSEKQIFDGIQKFRTNFCDNLIYGRIMKPGSLLQALRSDFFRLFSSFCSSTVLLAQIAN